MTFSTDLRFWRSNLNVTQEELARRMGISQSNVSEIERSENLEEATVRRYADALGLEVGALVLRKKKAKTRKGARR